MHNAAALLTVAIPTYNGAAHLSEALHSILSQECGPFDLIVCDDHSDDETVSLVRALAGARARIVVNKERLGLAGNWNQCVALSRTPWVNIFHQDDVMVPGHLSWVLDALERSVQGVDRVGLIACPVRVIDEQSQPVPRRVVDPGGIGPHLAIASDDSRLVEYSPSAQHKIGFWWRNRLRCSAVITNRAAHAEAGGFDPSYRYVLDWEFWYRVCRTRALWWRDDDPTVLVRWHAASETHRFKTGTEDLEEITRLLDEIMSQYDENSSSSKIGRGLANRKLGRAFLNRSHEALRCERIELAQTCLDRAWRLSSREVIGTLATDPRLCVQMGTLALWPWLAGRWFAKRG